MKHQPFNNKTFMKKKLIMLVALMTIGLSACSQTVKDTEMKQKVLVAYFSASGTTKVGKGEFFPLSRFRYSAGLVPTCALTYLPKNEWFAKPSCSEISFIESSVFLR